MARLLLPSGGEQGEEGTINNAGGQNHGLGWAVLDRDEQATSQVICAGIVVWVLHGRSDVELHVMECILLVDAGDGRGDSENEEKVVCR